MKQLKQRLLTYVLCPFLLLASPITLADNDIEISGLVIDRTLTRFGKDFGFYYSSYWRELPFTQGFNVTLYETVFPQAGTVLSLEVNGTRIYTTHFGRRANPVKESAEQAILITIDYLAQVRANAITGDFSGTSDDF
ncbi:MAG: curli production assembly/transport protein CsgE [Gammaproteobacteria bacterium]|uniref:Curli production assembly/transport component CsgE n=1 Tax=Shewanella septentrionalis TaxID=2952223 RepID=A0A9X3ASS6_9GAMM|nr:MULTISPECIES: curli production assembly/transport protein CsgE [Shewanella]MBU1392488.1 curli production assembly/transport protein CsgE [Gammaproteobacteria bacterium]MCT7944882.1 curli production assembly/transport protein CsgE [Shewanella septentrionalis]ABS07155.1 curli production assembly/transport component CsgE, putative [Shewanella baltica OS185]KZK68359.1 curli production assembly protein CsgE [Shewanella baltica]MBU1477531.1 curli production assembly/transport protein CsgE [Gammap